MSSRRVMLVAVVALGCGGEQDRSAPPGVTASAGHGTAGASGGTNVAGEGGAGGAGAGGADAGGAGVGGANAGAAGQGGGGVGAGGAGAGGAGAGGSAGHPVTCGATPGAGKCAPCAAKSCCPEIIACYVDSACVLADIAYDQCQLNGGETCLPLLSEAGPLGEALRTCKADKCAAKCN